MMAVDELFNVVRVPFVIVVCAMGICCHTLIIGILKHPTVHTPLMVLMMSLAVCQQLLFVSYAFFTLLYVHADIHCNQSLWSRAWVRALLTSIVANLTLHTIAVNHVLALSIVRYLIVVVRRPAEWFTHRRAQCTVFLVYVWSLIVCAPTCFLYRVQSHVKRDWCFPKANLNEASMSNTSSSSFYGIVQMPGLNERITAMSFWYFALTTKLLPGLVVLFISIRLMTELRVASQRKKNLMFRDTTTCSIPNSGVNSKLTTHTMLSKQTACSTGQSPIAVRISGHAAGQDEFIEMQHKRSLSLDTVDRYTERHMLRDIHSRQQHYGAFNITSVTNANRCVDKTHCTTEYDRTHDLILVVLLLFIVVELPQAILNCIVGVMGNKNALHYYSRIEDILEAVTIVYSSVNFAIFCAMNSSFRQILMSYVQLHNTSDRRRHGTVTPPLATAHSTY